MDSRLGPVVTQCSPLSCDLPCCAVQVVKVLADAGADLNLPENRGWTALMIAASRGCVESIEALLGELAMAGDQFYSRNVRSAHTCRGLQHSILRLDVQGACKGCNHTSILPALSAAIRMVLGCRNTST
jgi:ankyrin repeat protein